MNDEAERDEAMRRRLLGFVAQNLNEDVTHVAGHAISDILSDAPDAAEELLQPIFRWSTFWVEDLAKACLGLPQTSDHDLDELVERFEDSERSEKTDWEKSGF